MNKILESSKNSNSSNSSDTDESFERKKKNPKKYASDLINSNNNESFWKKPTST